MALGARRAAAGADVSAGAPAVPDPRRWLALFAALSAPFLGVVDFFVVNLALPTLQRDLGATYAQQELAIALYGLGYAVFVVTGGRLGDTHGRRRVFLVGMAAFIVASCLCASAPGAWFFLGARLLQGLSAAVVFPQVLALITMVTSEMIARQTGIGNIIFVSLDLGVYDRVYAMIVIIGALGFILDVLFEYMRSRLVAWAEPSQAIVVGST